MQKKQTKKPHIMNKLKYNITKILIALLYNRAILPFKLSVWVFTLQIFCESDNADGVELDAKLEREKSQNMTQRSNIISYYFAS